MEQGFSARYLLRTDIFQELKTSGARIVVLSPNHDEAYWKKEFESENVFVEPFQSYHCKQFFDRSRLQKFFQIVRLYSHNHNYPVPRTIHWYKQFKKTRQNDSLQRRFYNLVVDLAIMFLKRSKLLRRVFIFVECLLFPGHFHEELFRKYKPQLLLVTSLGNSLSDQFIMREARKHGTRVVSIILSWDNTTTKGMAGAFADKVIAWTPTMKEELVLYHDLPQQRITVGGAAHYDAYFNGGLASDRSKLLETYGFLHDRRLIFLCLTTPTQFPWNPHLVEVLAKAVTNDQLGHPCQLLVRPHPIYFKIENGRRPFQDEYEKLIELKKHYRFLQVDPPTILSQEMSFDMPKEEMKKLGSILKHADVLICWFSSMMIEASIFNVPTINMALFEKNDIPIHVSVSHNHIRRILDTGGVRTVYSEEDLLNTINLYLDRPGTDQLGRQRIVDNETGHNRGCAGKAIGREILKYLDSLNP